MTALKKFFVPAAACASAAMLGCYVLLTRQLGTHSLAGLTDLLSDRPA